MANAENDARYAHLSQTEATLVISIERVQFLKLEVLRLRRTILALPVDANYEQAHFRAQLNRCERSLIQFSHDH